MARSRIEGGGVNIEDRLQELYGELKIEVGNAGIDLTAQDIKDGKYMLYGLYKIHQLLKEIKELGALVGAGEVA